MKVVKQATAVRNGGYRVLRLTMDDGRVAEMDEEEISKWQDRAPSGAAYLGPAFEDDVREFKHDGVTYPGVTTDKAIVRVAVAWLNGE